MRNPGGDIGRDGFRLGDLTVEPREGRIRGSGGVEDVAPKVMAVLVELARQPGRVVSRDHLIERVWHTDCISDDVLSRCIYCLRRHLEVAGSSPELRKKICTLPRRGYRLVGPVVPIEPKVGTTPAGVREADAHNAERRFRYRPIVLLLLLGAALVYWWQPQGTSSPPPASADESPSLVILPFSDFGNQGGDEYLAHGITDALITLLTRSEPNQVIGRSSSFALAAGNSDPTGSAYRLGVSHVVEGSVRRNDDWILISVQLIEAETAATVWANRWKVPLSGLPEFETRIAGAIADQLGLSFQAPESVPSGQGGNSDSYIDQLHARYLVHRRNDGDLDEAILLFERAVERSPGLADAWAGLSTAAWLQAEENHSNPGDEKRRSELLEKARQAGERAVALEPDHAESLLRLSRMALGAGDAQRARALYVRARRAAPNDPTVLAMDAGIAFARGDHNGAISLLERALSRNPLAAAWRGNLAGYLNRTGQLDRAREEARRVIGMSDGIQRDRMRTLLAEIAVAQGRIEDARAQVENIAEPIERVYAQVLVRSAAGETEAAREAIQRLDAIDDPLARLHLAEAHAFRGESDAAMDIVRDLALSGVGARPSAHQVLLRGHIAVSRNLAGLRDHPDWPDRALQVPKWLPPARSDVSMGMLR